MKTHLGLPLEKTPLTSTDKTAGDPHITRKYRMKTAVKLIIHMVNQRTCSCGTTQQEELTPILTFALSSSPF
jgi:hypothetical protein